MFNPYHFTQTLNCGIKECSGEISINDTCIALAVTENYKPTNAKLAMHLECDKCREKQWFDVIHLNSISNITNRIKLFNNIQEATNFINKQNFILVSSVPIREAIPYEGPDMWKLK